MTSSSNLRAGDHASLVHSFSPCIRNRAHLLQYEAYCSRPEVSSGGPSVDAPSRRLHKLRFSIRDGLDERLGWNLKGIFGDCCPKEAEAGRIKFGIT